MNCKICGRKIWKFQDFNFVLDFRNIEEFIVHRKCWLKWINENGGCDRCGKKINKNDYAIIDTKEGRKHYHTNCMIKQFKESKK